MGGKEISFNWVGGIIRCLVIGNFVRDIIISKINGRGTGLVGTSFYLSLPSSVLSHTSCEEVQRFFSLPAGALEVSGKLEEEVLHGGGPEDLEAVVDALQGQDEHGVGEEARI